VKHFTIGKTILWALLLALLVGLGMAPGDVGISLAERLGNDAWRVLSVPLFKLGHVPVTPISLMKFVVFLLILTLVSRAGREFVRSLAARTSMDLGQQDAVARLSGYAVFALALIVGLESAGINLNSLLVVGGAVGIGVGFGLQTIANNFISGLILLIERPIKLGDRVDVGGTQGDVVRIAVRSTWVRTNDNVVIIIPNSEFVANRITNWTANDRQVRFSVPIGVSYGSDPEHVREVLVKAALEHPGVMQLPAPEVRFVGFGSSSLDFELRVWTTEHVQTPKTLISDLLFSIFRTFRLNGIEIPFPQRDLHLKTISAPIMISSRV